MAGAKPQLISTTVGRLKGEVVTSRQVEISQWVEKALYGRKKGDISSQSIKRPGEKGYHKEVNGVLIEWVVYKESKAFSAIRVKNSDIQSAKRQVLKVLGKQTMWTRLQVTSNELDDLITRKLLAKEFIRFKVDSSQIPLTEAEVRRYYDENQGQFGNLPFEKLKENITAYLKQQQVDRRLKDWFDILQAKFEVRNLVAQ